MSSSNLNSQAVSTFLGKLVNLFLKGSQDPLKGTVIEVQKDYFLFKKETEEKARSIFYFEDIESIKPFEIEWNKFLNQLVKITLRSGKTVQGYYKDVGITLLDIHFFNQTFCRQIFKCEIKDIETIFKNGDEIVLPAQTKATIHSIGNELLVKLDPSFLKVELKNKNELYSICEKIVNLANASKYLSKDIYDRHEKLAQDVDSSYDDIFKKLSTLFEDSKNLFQSLIKNDKADLFLYKFIREYIEIVLQYHKDNDNKIQIENFSLTLASIDKRITTLSSTKLIEDKILAELKEDKRILVTYRNKSRLVTILNKYTRNGAEYVVVTDHSDKGKVKTFFADKIEY